MQRKIIDIDESRCNGCGQCLPGCPEGALQIIEGKARLISDLFCDGLGACLGHCPEGAISMEEREASPYHERQVIAGLARQGHAVVDAHLRHLREHNEMVYLQEAMDYLTEQGLARPENRGVLPIAVESKPGGCPGTQTHSLVPRVESGEARPGSFPSELTHWPIQLHLISPRALHFQGSDLLLAADCVAFSMGGFHEEHLRGKTLAIACPKLDSGQEVYLEKLSSLIDDGGVKSVTVMIMQVPCCSGLLNLARRAVERSSRKVPIHSMVVSLRGVILQQG